MRRFLPQRVLLLTLGAVVVATVAVCAFGVHLTTAQYRAMEGILLETERGAARTAVRRLAGDLLRQERESLSPLSEAARRGAAVVRPDRAPAWLLDAFLVDRSGHLSAPSLRSPQPAGTLPGEGLPPPEFERAVRVSRGPGPLEPRLWVLSNVYESKRLAAPWRLQARVHMASRLSEAGRFEDAARIYSQTMAEFDDYLEQPTWPSRWQLALAAGEAEIAAGHPDTAEEVIIEAAGASPALTHALSLDEEEFFVRHALALLEAAGRHRPEVLSRRLEALTAERRVWQDLELVARRIRARAARTPSSLAPGEPLHDSDGAGRGLVAAVWTVVPTGESERVGSGENLTAVGYRVEPERLRAAVSERLGRQREPFPTEVRLESGTAGTDAVSLARFPPGLEFLLLVRDRDTWSAMLAEKRRPFLFAGVVIAALGAVLLASLVVLYRGVRRELSLSSMKTEFVANVSHELKTPLALIRLCGETLLLGRVRGAEQKNRYLQVITRESVRLGHLISNVLSFSSMEAGKKSYELRPTDLTVVVRETLANYRYHLEENGFTSHAEIPDDLPAVLADGEAVAQAMINLLQNAVRYCADRRHVEVRVARHGEEVVIEVRDEGVGISTDEQSRIWQDYYRARSARSLGTRGSGLGLSVVRHIMEAHGGSVGLKSRPGQGSTFSLRFPLAGSDRKGMPT